MHKDVEAAFNRAVEYFGSAAALARVLGVTPPLFRYWRNESRNGVPAERAVQIETVTGGLVRRWELRPDIFPRPDRQ